MRTPTRIDLTGKVALVTGGSRGIGEAIARSLAQHGAKVVLASRKLESVSAVASKLEQDGFTAAAFACHTGKPEEIDRLLESAVARFGQVDVLINNAATNPYFGTLLDVEWGAWEKTFEVNLKGYFAATRAVARHLIGRGAPGAIVNIASILGSVAAPMQGVYGMTKAAVISMTKTLAVELASQRIRVNAISPGLIETRLAAALIESEMLRKPIVDRTPAGRVGQPEDIATAAAFLASDAAAFVTGQNWTLDGGLTIT